MSTVAPSPGSQPAVSDMLHMLAEVLEELSQSLDYAPPRRRRLVIKAAADFAADLRALGVLP